MRRIRLHQGCFLSCIVEVCNLDEVMCTGASRYANMEHYIWNMTRQAIILNHLSQPDRAHKSPAICKMPCLLHLDDHMMH